MSSGCAAVSEALKVGMQVCFTNNDLGISLSQQTELNEQFKEGSGNVDMILLQGAIKRLAAFENSMCSNLSRHPSKSGPGSQEAGANYEQPTETMAKAWASM